MKRIEQNPTKIAPKMIRFSILFFKFGTYFAHKKSRCSRLYLNHDLKFNLLEVKWSNFTSVRPILRFFYSGRFLHFTRIRSHFQKIHWFRIWLEPIGLRRRFSGLLFRHVFQDACKHPKNGSGGSRSYRRRIMKRCRNTFKYNYQLFISSKKFLLFNCYTPRSARVQYPYSGLV